MRHPLFRILKRTRGQVIVPLLLSDLLSHDAKIAGNNLAWKVIVLCQMWKENQKRMRGMLRMSMGISKFGKQKQMKEMRTLNTLLEKFKNPTKADYATIAIA